MDGRRQRERREHHGVHAGGAVPAELGARAGIVAPHARAKLLSPRGGDGSDPSALPSFLARTSTYTAAELSKLALGARARVVDARIADIERQRKAVVLPDDSILPYDHLVLAPELGDASFVALGPEAASEALGVGALSGVGEEGVHVRLWSASAHTDTGVAKAGEALARRRLGRNKFRGKIEGSRKVAW